MKFDPGAAVGGSLGLMNHIQESKLYSGKGSLTIGSGSQLDLIHSFTIINLNVIDFDRILHVAATAYFLII